MGNGNPPTKPHVLCEKLSLVLFFLSPPPSLLTGGEPGGEAAQEGPEAGDAMCVEEGAGGDKAAGANVRRSSRLGVKGSQRRGAQFKKKVKISKKMKNKLQRNAEYPV